MSLPFIFRVQPCSYKGYSLLQWKEADDPDFEPIKNSLQMPTEVAQHIVKTRLLSKLLDPDGKSDAGELALVHKWIYSEASEDDQRTMLAELRAHTAAAVASRDAEIIRRLDDRIAVVRAAISGGAR
jgi:hypothetical protein